MSFETQKSSTPEQRENTLRIILNVADAMKFPSVKAQEVMMRLAELGEIQDMIPDLFDPSLDESLRQFEFGILSAQSQKEIEILLQTSFSQDTEIKSLVVKAPVIHKPELEQPLPESLSRQVRVDSRRLDELNRLAGELVILKEQVASVAVELNRFSKYPELLDLSKTLRRSVHGFHELAGEIQNRTREFQQLPVGSILQRFQRIARDTSRKLGKKIECTIEGAETEVDGTILERIGDLLVHLVRNSADHGIEAPEVRKQNGKPETGKIILRAHTEENHIVIEVADDGAGLDAKNVGAKALKLGLVTEKALSEMPDQEVLKFIFKSGFSTTDAVGEVSGRGVGLDVVKARAEELNGVLDFRTELGKGTTFSIRLPVSISIVQALLVECDTQIFAIPLVSVLRILKVGLEDQIEILDRNQFRFADGNLSARFLSHVISPIERNRRKTPKDRFLIELGYGVERYGLVVDRVIGRREIVIRPLSQVLGQVEGVSGVATLGDGKIVVVLDARLLFEKRINRPEDSEK